MNQDHLLPPPCLRRSHFNTLCTTGGTQPFGNLLPVFQDEWIVGDSTCFLDAPTFAPAGSTARIGPFEQGEKPSILPSIYLLDRRIG